MKSGELDIKIQEVETSFKKQVMAELRDVQERLRNLDVRPASGREIREVKRQQAGGLAGAEPAHSISVTRARNVEVAVFQPNETTASEPGDITDVEKVLPGETRHRRPAYRI
jgi:polysaccharide biosynthesis/export protein